MDKDTKQEFENLLYQSQAFTEKIRFVYNSFIQEKATSRKPELNLNLKMYFTEKANQIKNLSNQSYQELHNILSLEYENDKDLQNLEANLNEHLEFWKEEDNAPTESQITLRTDINSVSITNQSSKLNTLSSNKKNPVSPKKGVKKRQNTNLDKLRGYVYWIIYGQRLTKHINETIEEKYFSTQKIYLSKKLSVLNELKESVFSRVKPHLLKILNSKKKIDFSFMGLTKDVNQAKLLVIFF